MADEPPLLRGRGIHLLGVGIGVVIGIGALVVVQIATGGAIEPVLLVVAIAVAIVISAGAVVLGLLLGRRAFGRRLEVAVRPAGERRWQHGHIEASPGRMRFHRYRWQVRIATGEPVELVVHAIGPDLGERPSKRQLLSVNPALHVIDVETDRGTMQLGLQAHQVDDVRSRLQPDGVADRRPDGGVGS